MGDTGRLALGGAIAALAIMTRTELLFLLIGGLFVIITCLGDRAGGLLQADRQRMLRMAPLHHHFEMLGWAEITIVVRFWMIQGLCVAAGLALFYAEWVRVRCDDLHPGLRLVAASRWPWPASASRGFAAADALLQPGRPGDRRRRPATARGSGARQILEVLGATVRLGDGDTLPDAVDLLVVSRASRRCRRSSRRPGGGGAGLGGAGAARGACATQGAAPGWSSPAPTARPPPP